jgi:ubiquinone/menaquinone biosynthesis C-methylase UbiE
MTKEEVLQQFGDNAEAYVTSTVHAKGASLKRLIELVKPQADWEVLDVATGAGHTALTFAPFVALVTATDITPEMLAQAENLAAQKNISNIVFETADAGSLPYPESTFDLVTCRIAPHHFPDIGEFVREAARVLKPGGILAVVDNIVPEGPAGDYVNAFEKFRDPSHSRCWSLEAWLETFRQAGFRITHQETLAKRLDFQFWAQRHDPLMQAYLQAMLWEAGPQAIAFLQPQLVAGGLSFRLVEGILTGQKTT